MDFIIDAKLNFQHHPSEIIIICWFAAKRNIS